MKTVGDKFPAFSLQGINENNEFVKVDIEESYTPLKKDWSVVYFYPKDFTFICPTEIADMDKLNEEAIVMGISSDNEFCKLHWRQTNPLLKDIKHTLACDAGLVLSGTLDIIDMNELVSSRATFIVNPEGIIQYASMNALDTGRNADEILRTIQALKADGLTGCSWKPGDQFVA